MQMDILQMPTQKHWLAVLMQMFILRMPTQKDWLAVSMQMFILRRPTQKDWFVVLMQMFMLWMPTQKDWLAISMQKSALLLYQCVFYILGGDGLKVPGYFVLTLQLSVSRNAKAEAVAVNRKRCVSSWAEKSSSAWRKSRADCSSMKSASPSQTRMRMRRMTAAMSR